MSERTNNLIFIEDTRFIYRTNFAGLPDKFGNTSRKGNILIQPEIAQELLDEGFDVRMTKPREGEEEGFVPRYYTSVIVNYTSEYAKTRPPKIYLTERNRKPVPLYEDNIGMLDSIYILNVNVTLQKSKLKKFNDRPVLYVVVMYVEHDEEDDPWRDRYNFDGQPEEDD